MRNSSQLGPYSSSSSCFAAGGEAGAVMRSLNWSKTLLGPVESWSHSLSTTVKLLLADRSPLGLWWGPKYCQIYNDAYRPILGSRHPKSMGQSASLSFPEFWRVAGPLIETPFRKGTISWMGDLQVECKHYKETHFTISCSPVLDFTAPKSIGGVLGTVQEITQRIVEDRRTELLQDLRTRSSKPKNVEEACLVISEILERYTKDIPFALFYLLDGNGHRGYLAAASGLSIAKTKGRFVAEFDVESPAPHARSFVEALNRSELTILEPLPEKLAKLARGPWADPPTSAAVMRIPRNAADRPMGLLVLGMSSRLPFDENYRAFFELVGHQIAAAITDGHARTEQALQRITNENLRRSEQRLRLLLEIVPHHIWSFRPDGAITYSNRRLKDYTGLSAEELRSGGWAAIHPDDVERVKSAWRMAFEHGSEFEMEIRIRGRDGGYRRFFCHGVPVKDEHGHAVEWFGTGTDVEDRRRTEESLYELQTELAHIARVNTMGELAATIAHEVKQPLTAIVTDGNAGIRWLQQSPPNIAEAQIALEGIVKQGLMAGEVIGRIRALIRKSEPQITPVDLNELIRQVLALTREQLHRRNMPVSTDLSLDLPAIMGDSVQLQQVLLNLILNAIEATEDSTHGDNQLLITSASRGEHEALVSVRDSGAGIKPEHFDKLFTPFFTTKANGIGMGLVISRSIIEAHGGQLWATPNIGRGVTFQFLLPVRRMV